MVRNRTGTQAANRTNEYTAAAGADRTERTDGAVAHSRTGDCGHDSAGDRGRGR